MGLAKNLYRRQAVYWWRRRFADPENRCSREIAISLRVQRPDLARRIADALNDKAYKIAQRLESRMTTFESARHELAEVVNTITWTLDPSADASLCALESRRVFKNEEAPAAPSPDQEHALLLALGREAEADLVRNARHNLLEAAKDSGAANPTSDAITTEKAFAVIFAAIANGGYEARITDSERAELAGRFSSNMIAFIEREVAFYAKREREMSWSLGPPRAYFEDKLRAFGIEPSLGAVRLLRRDYLLLFAALLEKADRRYRPSPIAAVLRTLVPDETAAVSVLAAMPAADREIASCPDSFPTPTFGPATNSIMMTADTSTSFTGDTGSSAARKPFTAHVQTLIRQNAKSGAWKPKTCNQHESLARLFVKLVGSDDPTDMRQEHVGKFRSLLDELPKNWGKSPADANRTIEEICARAQDLDESEVGLAPGTIDRQLTQLSSILEHLRVNGFPIGEVTAKMRTGGANTPRGVFSLDDYATLFKSSVFTGCKSAADRLTPGELLIHDDQFFMPILGRHTLGRLHEIAGLMIDDIDSDRHAIIIQDNAERSVKSEGANRRQPAVPEIVRLGFFAYCRDMRDAGHKLVFPGLRERGARTPLSNLAYKKFKLLLDAVLPLASEQKKSFHSFRTDGNTIMCNANVNDAIRHAVMGHAHTGVNEAHYLSGIYDEAKLMALAAIPVVTSHLQPYRGGRL